MSTAGGKAGGKAEGIRNMITVHSFVVIMYIIFILVTKLILGILDPGLLISDNVGVGEPGEGGNLAQDLAVVV